jgi:hypothetical protein
LLGLHEVGEESFEGDFDFLFFLVAPDFEMNFVAGEFAFDDFVHIDFFAVDFDEAVAEDGAAVDFEEDVADLEEAAGGAVGIDIGDHDADAVVGEFEGAALGGVEDIEFTDGEVDVVIVVIVFDVFEEAFDDGDGDHVTDILGDGAGVTLEGDADDFFVLEDGTAAISGVDGGVDLDGEMEIDGAVAVGAEVDT